MSHVLEIARFTVKAGMESKFLEERPAAMKAIRKRFPGLLSVHLVRFGPDDWGDVAVWQSRCSHLLLGRGGVDGVWRNP